MATTTPMENNKDHSGQLELTLRPRDPQGIVAAATQEPSPPPLNLASPVTQQPPPPNTTAPITQLQEWCRKLHLEAVFTFRPDHRRPSLWKAELRLEPLRRTLTSSAEKSQQKAQNKVATMGLKFLKVSFR